MTLRPTIQWDKIRFNVHKPALHVLHTDMKAHRKGLGRGISCLGTRPGTPLPSQEGGFLGGFLATTAFP